MTIGILHPGSMGSAIGGLLGDAAWAGDGRSVATADRAAKAGMHDLVSRVAFVEAVDMIISVVPPSAAASVAEEVASVGFRGIYVDANAISPATSVGIGDRFDNFVDGGIVGPPPHEAGTTRLYLSAIRRNGPRGAGHRHVARIRLGAEDVLRRVDEGHQRPAACGAVGGSHPGR